MKPRAATILFATLLTFTLLACGSPSESEPDATQNSETSTAPDAHPGSDGDTTEPAETTGDANLPPTAPQTDMQRFLIDQGKHPLAVCNDGSRPVFYFRPGVGSGKNKWVIWFRGGGECHTEAVCKARTPYQISSKPFMTDAYRVLNADNMADGILNPDSSKNPDFYNWSHAFLMYCSSDLWSGTADKSDATYGYYFRGHYIVNAMIDALQDEAIIGTQTLQGATEILFAGGSAGSAGLRHNIDRLAAKFPSAKVKGVADAAFIPHPAMLKEGYEDPDAMKKWTLWKPIYDSTCVEANSQAPWSCSGSIAQVLDGQISTPLFIHQDQYDPLGDDSVPPGTDPQTFFETVAEMTRVMLGKWPGAFSPAQRRHTVLVYNYFYTDTVDGLTIREVLGNWYFGRPGKTTVIEQP